MASIIIVLAIIIILIIICFVTIYIEKIKALIKLCNLSSTDIETYFNSYEAYSHQHMISSKDDYKNKKPATTFVINSDKKPSEYTAECYSILNTLCALGNIKKMYIPKCIDNTKSLIKNQELQEKEISQELKCSPNSKILELGCGCGRIACHISEVTKSTVYGINIDKVQIKDAISYSKQNKKDVNILFADFNDKLPFEDNMFDAVYTVQGLLAFVSDFTYTFSEIYRILKPNGRFVISDVVLLDNFDKNKKRHLELMQNARYVMAGGNFVYYKYIEDFARNVNFKIFKSQGGKYPNVAQELELLKLEDKNFENIQKFINFFTKIGVLPIHMNDLIKRLREGGKELIEMEELNLLTMNWDFTFEKPG